MNYLDLKKKYLFSVLPQAIKETLFERSRVEGDVLVVECQSRKHAAQLRSKTYRSLLYTVGTASQNTYNLSAVRYDWGGGADELPLVFDSTIDFGQVPVLKDLDLVETIESYAQQTGLPASCLTMDVSRPLFASNNCDRSCGVPKSDFLSRTSVEDCFPPLELISYKDAILRAAGRPVDLKYVAAGLHDRQLYQRHVRAQLIRTSWGDLARLCFVLTLPRSIGREIGSNQISGAS